MKIRIDYLNNNKEVRNDNRKPKKAHIRDIDECRRYCWDKVADTLKNRWYRYWIKGWKKK